MKKTTRLYWPHLLNLVLGMTLFMTWDCHAETKVIRTPPIVTGNDNYSYKMIKLANSHIDNKYQITSETGEERTQTRYRADVLSDIIDIMWTATDNEVEGELQPIRIPLYKGLLGHRIFLIEKDSQYKFDQVKTFADLQKLTFGQGTSWADTKILEANGLKVVKTMTYKNLLYMTDGGRFDAFPRGVHEPWKEMTAIPGLNLTVEKNIMVVYKMPFYLFVSKDRPQLAKDIELGLNRAIADGTFDEVFMADPSVKQVFEKANLKNRIVFQLKNPNLPPNTPVDRPELWFDVEKLK